MLTASTNLSSSTSKSPVSTFTVIGVLFAFILATIIVLGCKKVYYRFVKKERYYIFPKTNVKGITNIAMVISISIASIILLTFLSAGVLAVLFRAYPGWRATIEGILIKIGGLLFGPIIGIFIGAFTDLLTVGMTAGMFHYGYFVVAIAYGFIAGLIRTTLNVSKNKDVVFMLVSTLFIVVIYAAIYLYISQVGDECTISLFTYDISINQNTMVIIFSVLFIVVLALLWGCALVFDFWRIIYGFQQLIYDIKFIKPLKRFREKLYRSSNPQKIIEKHINWTASKEEHRKFADKKLSKTRSRIDFDKIKIWSSYFVPVLVAVFSCETIVEILVMPVFDVSVSALKYDYWFAFRLVMLVFMIPMNILIIFPIYRIVASSMKYNYTTDIVESINVPLLVS